MSRLVKTSGLDFTGFVPTSPDPGDITQRRSSTLAPPVSGRIDPFSHNPNVMGFTDIFKSGMQLGSASYSGGYQGSGGRGGGSGGSGGAYNRNVYVRAYGNGEVRVDGETVPANSVGGTDVNFVVVTN